MTSSKFKLQSWSPLNQEPGTRNLEPGEAGALVLLGFGWREIARLVFVRWLARAGRLSG